MAKNADTVSEAAPRFSKAQLLRSGRYKARRDLVGALLKDGVKYSLEDVDAAIEKYTKGKVG
nr:MAG TPA: hypothetical protein [Caudoviricetes sp.]